MQLINKGLRMDNSGEQRAEERLAYDWPIWFGEDFEKAQFAGQMVNVSSKVAVFTCHADKKHPYEGQELTLRFSVPRFGPGGEFNKVAFTKSGRICRVEDEDEVLRRVAVQFDEPLFFKPGEQGISASEAQRKLGALAV